MISISIIRSRASLALCITIKTLCTTVIRWRYSHRYRKKPFYVIINKTMTKGFYKGWRYAAFLSGFAGFISVALYPIIISPMMDASEYQKIQKETRKNIKQEDIQPGNMKVWSDPFDRKKPVSE